MEAISLKEKIIPVKIEEEVKVSYMDYAMSVIIGRALPDVRDGLKPVHRRILYTMYEMNLTPTSPYKKSARVVGDTMGKYHPHGDAPIYEAMVRMAQEFTTRYKLIDGHGNFGSVDGDEPAAMRYTEVRLSHLSQELLRDIDKETVDFTRNYDGSLQEPRVLPSSLPNLLINGSQGIAVGMATNIPPHNLSEIIDALIMLIDNKDATVDELMQIVQGPDFPTGGYIRGKEGIIDAYKTGRGSITIRGRYEKEITDTGKQRIVITELPYQVNKAELVKNIAELVREKKIEGVGEVRDESDRRGMSIVLELKRDANPDYIIKYLCKHTNLQTTFGIIMLTLVDGVPKVLNLKQMLEEYLKHREEVVKRRTEYDLKKAQNKAHILEGLKVALKNLDTIIKIIREAQNSDEAKNKLMKKFKLTDIQSQGILDMRLGRLTKLERTKIDEDYKQTIKDIEYYESLLKHRKKILQVIKEELLQIKDKYADARRTIIFSKGGEIDYEETIPYQDIIITLTQQGYIKRMEPSYYRVQKRGGKGIKALTRKQEEDIVKYLLYSSTHHYILFFTNKGLVYRLKAYEVPPATRQAKGTPVVNLLQLSEDEKVTTAISIKEFKEDEYLFMVTKKGVVKKTSAAEFVNILRTGKIAISLDEGDSLLFVALTKENQEIILVTKYGMAIRFNQNNIREMGRQARGIRGIRLRDFDEVQGMAIIDEKNKDDELLTVTELGYGKRTKLELFRPQMRGGKGIKAIKVTDKNGKCTAIEIVNKEDEVLLVSEYGVMIRVKVKDIGVQSRSAQGVRIMKLSKGDRTVAVEKIEKEVA